MSTKTEFIKFQGKYVGMHENIEVIQYFKSPESLLQYLNQTNPIEISFDEMVEITPMKLECLNDEY